MRQVRCGKCGGQFPMRGSFVLFGKQFCKTCFEAELPTHPQDEVTRETAREQGDPTVCGECGKDNGALELPTLMGVPLCEECMGRYRRRPFPTWVKAFTGAILALTVASFALNWNYLRAYTESHRASRLMRAENYKEAARLFRSAADLVPSNENLAVDAEYAEIMVLRMEGKADEALEKARRLAKRYPSDVNLKDLADLCLAERELERAGEAARNEDYARATTICEELLGVRPQDKVIQVYLIIFSTLKAADDGDTALAEERLRQLKEMKAQNVSEPMISNLEIVIAFAKKDYDAFLEKARQVRKVDPNTAISTAQVASALACKYAATGEERFKTEALSVLKEAEALATNDEEMKYFKEYQERILHRLNTREIIDRKEYNRRFHGPQTKEGSP